MAEALSELTSLGLTNRQIAGICGIGSPNTVSGWRNRGMSPGKSSQFALSRVGKVIDHLRVDLELDDPEITWFLTEEPTRIKPYDLDERWDEERAAADRVPLVNHIGDSGRVNDGLLRISERILERYFDVQLEGNYTQPQTYVYHLIDV